jgi:hypothetical protein
LNNKEFTMPETDPLISLIRCHYRDSAGRRCRLPREKGHPTFCTRHARPRFGAPGKGAVPIGNAAPGKGAVPVGNAAPGKGAVPVGNAAPGKGAVPVGYLPAADLTPDLLGPLNDFRTNTSINYTLGRLLILKAADQISARDASVVAYICQLLLQSVPGVRKEMSWSRGQSPEDQSLRSVLQATSSLWDDADAPEVVAAPK